MILGFIIGIFVGISIVLLLSVKQFGAVPKGERLERIKKSPNYKKDKFENLSFTPVLEEGHSFFSIFYNNFFKSKPRHTPKDILPSVKTDLLHLSEEETLLVWFGHSSYFLKIDGKTFLIDPVFSGSATPFSKVVKSFKGSDVYTVDDLPNIDFLIITHDHYDHVDYKTVIQLKEKTSKIICGLGVGGHFEKWGFSSHKIVEKDWYENEEIAPGFTVFVEPTRHFSGRGLNRNNTLWASYILKTPSLKLYIGGDSGYDTHYAEIGRKHTDIDLAILDNGQYNPAWKAIHNSSEEVLKAAKELNAKRVFPVHSSKFALSTHPWDEPLKRITELNKSEKLNLITPKIGEKVNLRDSNQKFENWWENVN